MEYTESSERSRRNGVVGTFPLPGTIMLRNSSCPFLKLYRYRGYILNNSGRARRVSPHTGIYDASRFPSLEFSGDQKETVTKAKYRGGIISMNSDLDESTIKRRAVHSPRTIGESLKTSPTDSKRCKILLKA